MTLLRIEWKRWLRSRTFLILCAVFIFSGLTSPLMTYYSRDILASMGGAYAQALELPEPSWQELIISYFKNASQLSLFVGLYLICQLCLLGKSDSLRLFYLTRTKSPWRLYLPKITMSLSLLSVASLLGQLTAFYTTWTLFNDLVWSDILKAFLWHWLGLLIFALFALCLALYSQSAFLPALVVEVFIILSGVLTGSQMGKWLPSNLLSLSTYFEKGVVLSESPFLWILGLMVLLSLLGLHLLRLSYDNR